MFALTDAAITGLFATIGTLFVTAGTITVALLARDTRQHSKATARTAAEFEEAYKQRGEIIDGQQADIKWLTDRVGLVEAREQECRERLTALEAAQQ